ncbi:WG repeat-containing protein [Mangrovivirga sp. M17]|uniref:WG repeat-containing protein n=1 Tax=Mangrovivirga halotolerans TaxID=2993936 RepID=A0ABT3RV45_9BACT|nr:WG repeat-containing protein [Mangrovivirga halotolerans]MCX2745634.1 WG repeat-containing protein [Mangrovivirga halotolerans]
MNQLIILSLSIISIFSCGQKSKKEGTNYTYFDKIQLDTKTKDPLIAVTNEEYLQYGSRVAYLNIKGDTIIPFGKYAYLGTDTLTHFANVIEFPKDSSYGRWIAIDRNQNTLYDIVSFDNGPDYFHEGLVRAKRNGKMGFADKYGQISIPCEYDFAWWFEDGKAKVTFDAREIRDKYDDHTRIESDEWFYIDKNGKEIK